MDAQGRTLEVHKIHQPGPLYFTAEELDETAESHQLNIDFKAGDRLPLSYVNFYIANGGVICAAAQRPARRASTGSRFRAVPGAQSSERVRARAQGGSSSHCITQQQPKSR